MKPQFNHKLATSYILWFENYFFKKSEAYSIQTGTFTYYQDNRLPSVYKTFGLPFKQIVYDSSLPNAYIPSGVYSGNSFIEFEKDTKMFDFENGRFIGSGISSGSNITGKFTAKEINIYYTNDTEENIIINAQEKLNKAVSNPQTLFFQPYEQKMPAIFLSNDTMQNKPFAFGGMNETKVKARATVLANNIYELDTVLSVFGDSYNQVIPLVKFDSHPFDEYGGLKTGYYSYEDLKTGSPDQIFVKDVFTSKMSDKLKQNLLKDLYIGFIDFDFSIYRFSD